MLKNKKRHILTTAVIAVFLILSCFIYWVWQSPHHLTTQQVLQRFNWQASGYHKDFKGTLVFHDKTITIDDHSDYAYHISNNETLTVDNGPLKGTYQLKDDATDYYLMTDQKKQFFLDRQSKR